MCRLRQMRKQMSCKLKYFESYQESGGVRKCVAAAAEETANMMN